MSNHDHNHTPASDRLQESAEHVRKLGSELIAQVETMSGEIELAAEQLQETLREVESTLKTTKRRVHAPVNDIVYAGKKLVREVRHGYRNVLAVLR